MHNHTVSRISSSTPRRHNAGFAPYIPLRRLDPLFASLNQLGVVTPAFLEQYCINRRKALEKLALEFVFLQSLYEGARPPAADDNPSLQVDAMELNAQLISTANFGKYSTAEKVNILYQLRRALDMLQKRYFSL